MRILNLAAIAFTLNLMVAASIPAAEVYTATAEFESARTLGTSRMTFRLVVDRPSASDEAKQLRDLLAQGGQEMLISALRARSDGKVQLGSFEIGVSLVVVTPTAEGGRRVVVVTERPYRRTIEGEPADAAFPFGLLSFEVNSLGSGEGSLIPAASLTIDENGEVKADSSTGESGRLLDVRLED